MICKLTIAYKRHYKYSCSASTNVWHKIHARAATLGCLHSAWQSRELKKLSLYSTTIIRDSVTRRYSLKSKSYFINGRNKRIHYFHYEFAHMLVEQDNTVQYWSAQFVRLLYKRLLEEENAQTTIFCPFSVCIQVRFYTVMETFVHGMPGESTTTVICEKLSARAKGNENLPATSRSLYRERVIKKMNQATGITPQHTFRENRSLLTRVTTRIASLLSFDTSTTQLWKSRRDVQRRKPQTVDISTKSSTITLKFCYI